MDHTACDAATAGPNASITLAWIWVGVLGLLLTGCAQTPEKAAVEACTFWTTGEPIDRYKRLAVTVVRETIAVNATRDVGALRGLGGGWRAGDSHYEAVLLTYRAALTPLLKNLRATADAQLAGSLCGTLSADQIKLLASMARSSDASSAQLVVAFRALVANAAGNEMWNDSVRNSAPEIEAAVGDGLRFLTPSPKDRASYAALTQTAAGQQIMDTSTALLSEWPTRLALNTLSNTPAIASAARASKRRVENEIEAFLDADGKH